MIASIIRQCLKLMPVAALLMLPVGEARGKTAQEHAQQVFPTASEWKSWCLSDEVQLLRGMVPDQKTHQYCALRKVKGENRLVMTYIVASAHHQFARFALKNGEVMAYHTNGALLARMPLWESPPALYAPAEPMVQLRLTGTDDNLIYCEAENLTRFPVLLRPGNVSIIITKGERITLSNLFVKLRETTLLPPRGKARLRLDLIIKRRKNPEGLTKAERVELVYHAQESAVITQPQAIAPAAILQPGMPELGETGRCFPIRLRDDLAVIQRYSPTGRAEVKQLEFYRLHKGVWQHITTELINSYYRPAIFQCEETRVRIYAITGRTLAEVQLSQPVQ